MKDLYTRLAERFHMSRSDAKFAFYQWAFKIKSAPSYTQSAEWEEECFRGVR